jgi:adenylate cyclase
MEVNQRSTSEAGAGDAHAFRRAWAFVPQDRRPSAPCPASDGTPATVLVVDISGFSALARTLVQSLGARRGADQLAERVQAVYEPLVAAVELHRGSVVSFAGDALMCCFAGPRAGDRARECAQAMHSAMSAEGLLRLRAGIASGPVRRLLLGDPAHQCFDLLAGDAVVRAARAQSGASAGATAVDATTPTAPAVALSPWRQDPAPAPWLPAALAERLAVAPDRFAAELRPTVALFLGFDGLDLDGDTRAAALLDTLVRTAQQRVAARGGCLVQVTQDEKGCYLYAAFGALFSHEDDAARCLDTALDLRATLPDACAGTPWRMGVASGISRTGPYGAPGRAAFGVLGEAPNLAARLMVAGAPGDILVSAPVERVLRRAFDFAGRDPTVLKGWTQPQPAHSLVGRRAAPAIGERGFAGRMVGREAVLAHLGEALVEARAGRPRLTVLRGDPGVGKSRLLARMLHDASALGFAICAGACEAQRQGQAYAPWRTVWPKLLGLPATPSAAEVAAAVVRWQGASEDAALLGPVLGLPADDGDDSMPAQVRQLRRLRLLQSLLRACAGSGPLLIALEDLQWADRLSVELLPALVPAVAGLPVAFVVTERPEGPSAALASLPGAGVYTLGGLDPDAVLEMVSDRLPPAVHHDAKTIAQWASRVDERAEGNPFFVEELLLYMLQSGDPAQPAGAATAPQPPVDLPSSLDAVILARFDRLSPTRRLLLRHASVLGRHFDPAEVAGAFPDLGDPALLAPEWNGLVGLDLLRPNDGDGGPDLSFKHALTRDVVYQGMPRSSAVSLHTRFAQWLEQPSDRRDRLGLLAHHWGCTDDHDKQRLYFEQAADAARAAYANETALAHYDRLLPLASEPALLHRAERARAQVLEHVGRWTEALQGYHRAVGHALQRADADRADETLRDLGRMHALLGNWRESVRCMERAAARWRQRGKAGEVAATLILLADAPAALGGQYAAARACVRRARRLLREVPDPRLSARADAAVCQLALRMRGAEHVLAQARALHDEALAAGDLGRAALWSNRMGLRAYFRGDFASALRWFEDSMALADRCGSWNRRMIAASNVALVRWATGDLVAIRDNESRLRECRERGFVMQASALEWMLGDAALHAGQAAQARAHFLRLLVDAELAGTPLRIRALKGLAHVQRLEGDPLTAIALMREALRLSRSMNDAGLVSQCLLGLAVLAVERGDPRATDHVLAFELGLSAAEVSALDVFHESLRQRLQGVPAPSSGTRVRSLPHKGLQSLLDGWTAAVVSEPAPGYAELWAEARIAIDREAFSDALCVLDRLMVMAPDLASRADVLRLRGRSLHAASRYAEARESVEQSLTLARRQKDATRTGLATMELARTWIPIDDAVAIMLLQQAAALLRCATAPAEEARALTMLSELFNWRREINWARASARRARRLARQAGDTVVQVMAEVSMAFASLRAKGYNERSLLTLQRAADFAASLARLRWAGVIATRIGGAYFITGRFALAAQAFERALGHVRACGNRSNQQECLLGLWQTRFELGDPDIMPLLRTMLDETVLAGRQEWAIECRLVMAALSLDLGDVADARRVLESSAPGANARQRAIAEFMLACADIHDEFYERAEGRVRGALVWMDSAGISVRIPNFRLVLAAALARMGRHAEQRDVLDAIEREVQKMNIVALERIFHALLPVALEGVEDHPLGARFAPPPGGSPRGPACAMSSATVPTSACEEARR